MPLPHDAFTIHGGCNCSATRYQVSIPPFSSRPHNPYHTPGADIGDLRIPMVAICHCNDCRRATASILPHALVTDISTVTGYATSLASPEDERCDSSDDEHWAPAAHLFDPTDPALAHSHLTFYKSSPGRTRWFCRRCGTNVAYSIDEGVVPEEYGWPQMLDIWLGTVDRGDLKRGYMRPGRQLWCDEGVPWIRRLARGGAGGVPEHPRTKTDELVKDGGEGQM